MTTGRQAWALTAALIAIHQTEEVLVSIEGWQQRVGTTSYPELDRRLVGNWLASTNPVRRVIAQTAQSAALGAAYLLTRDRPLAARTATTALCLGWSAAFCMHLTVSARTRSLMPGTVSSLIPGLPGAAWVLAQIWSPDSPRRNHPEPERL